MKKHYLTFLLIIIASCGTSLHVQKMNNSGMLPTSTKLANGEVVIDKSIDIDSSYHFLVVKNVTGVNTYGKYIISTLRNIGRFDTVYTQEELETFIVQHGLADKISNISDNIELYKLQKEVGNFLICETSGEHLAGYNYKFHFKIINPANSETLLEIDHAAFNWNGLDKPLFNPVFNYYIDWLSRNKK